jgi:hypothetical protein
MHRCWVWRVRLITKINLVRILNTPLTEDEMEEDWGCVILRFTHTFSHLIA